MKNLVLTGALTELFPSRGFKEASKLWFIRMHSKKPFSSKVFIRKQLIDLLNTHGAGSEIITTVEGWFNEAGFGLYNNPIGKGYLNLKVDNDSIKKSVRKALWFYNQVI